MVCHFKTQGADYQLFLRNVLTVFMKLQFKSSILRKSMV